MKEQWKAFADGFYEVSNLGRARRLKDGRSTSPGRLLKPNPDKDGYHLIHPCVRGKRTVYKLHSLVAKMFVGPCPRGHEVNHKDGVKGNNRATNLEYVTHSQNLRHAYASGLHKAKIPQEVVDRIWKLREQGKTLRQIEALTGVSNGHCGRIVRGVNRQRSA